jgi:hypothetical protein
MVDEMQSGGQPGEGVIERFGDITLHNFPNYDIYVER